MTIDPRDEQYAIAYLEKCKELSETLKGERENIARVVDVLYRAWCESRMVFVAGNGGSASTATHFAADLAKTIIPNSGDPGIPAIALADNIPLASATVNDWGWDRLYESQLRTYWKSNAVFIAFSVHGGSGSDKAGAWSQNLLRAMQYAKDRGGTTIGFAGYDGGAMKRLADICVIVPADSTPLVESFHVVLGHLITFALKERIVSSPPKEDNP